MTASVMTSISVTIGVMTSFDSMQVTTTMTAGVMTASVMAGGVIAAGVMAAGVMAAGVMAAGVMAGGVIAASGMTASGVTATVMAEDTRCLVVVRYYCYVTGYCCHDI